MRFKSIELINYIGIYNGMGLKKIFIDFTKCLNHLIIIRGDNGSGKSTLFKAISILPDSNDGFIPNQEARKTIEILDGEVLYKILYVHTPNNKDSFSTKGFFYKMVDGVFVDMNPLGSITTCKDLIFTEFNLDYNFEALTRLSAEDKGLAAKKPAERKQFINSITDSLEVYNDINKTMRQRTTSFKTMITSINRKLKELGDINLLNSSLNSLSKRIMEMKATRDNLVDYKATKRFIITTLDPDGSILNTYNTSSMKLNSLSSKKQMMLEKISSAFHTTHLTEDMASEDYLKYISDQKTKIQFQLQSIDADITRSLTEREEDNRSLQAKVAKLRTISSETNYDQLKIMIEDLNIKIESYRIFFQEAGIINTDISKEEYITGANTLMSIKEAVDIFKEMASYDVMIFVLDNYVNTGIYPDTSVLEDANDNLKELIDHAREERAYQLSQSEIAAKLANRPDGCKINDCYFIVDAYNASLNDPLEQVKRLTAEIDANTDILNANQAELEKLYLYIRCINQFKTLYRYIENNKSILSKLPVGEIFSDKARFTEALINGSTFDEIYQINSYVSQASIFEDYNRSKIELERLNNELKLYESKNDIVIEIQTDITHINFKLDELTSKLNDLMESKVELNNLLEKYSSTELSIRTVLDLKQQLSSINNEESETNQSLSAIAESIAQINDATAELNRVNSDIERYNHEIDVLEKDKEKITYSMIQFQSYKEELELYMAKYNKMEVIKKYSSPTKNGIQLIFIELYMGTVIEIANSLLRLVLNGEYHLEKPIINETEFRLPIQGEGFLNDDILSLSSGQSSLVATVVNAALMYQSSTKFNVPKYDEIDAALDSYNRAKFPILIEELRKVVGFEQCIMISHNNEINLAAADIIILKTSDPDIYEIPGNIIFQY